MKQNLIVGISALFLYSNSHADSELNLVIKGGPDAATLEHDNRENRYGFSGGISAYSRSQATERLFAGAQLELLYTQRGAEIVLDGMKEGESRSHYMDLVLAVRPGIRLGPADIYLLLGGSLSYLIVANKSVSGMNQDITGDLHRIDVALLAGAGLALHLPRQDLGPLHLGTVFLEARHDIGLLDTDAVNGGYKNRSSSLMLGLSFILGAPTMASSSSANQATTRRKSGGPTVAVP
jgi:hypothetical protein